MPEVLVGTPLEDSAVTKPYVFSDGISIRELSPILWDISFVKDCVSKEERECMAEARYWLCASKEVEHLYTHAGDDLLAKARDAALALQIICPSGAKHVFLKFHKTDRGYNNIGSEHPKELCNTLLGHITNLEQQGLQQQFDAVYAGIRRASTEQIVRLQNPVLLLEHGMQIGNVNLGALMFVMGLDMLLMAGEIGTFMNRLGGFLGLDSYVFPPTCVMNRQPNTVVRDVLKDLYEFRNIIAHGQEIPEDPYRRKSDIISTDGSRINDQNHYRAQLMLESGLFMLTTALRRIFTEGLVDEVKHTAKWRARMTLYEHRYKDSGGPTAIKTRRR
jgi:hypothetical protein